MQLAAVSGPPRCSKVPVFPTRDSFHGSFRGQAKGLVDCADTSCMYLLRSIAWAVVPLAAIGIGLPATPAQAYSPAESPSFSRVVPLINQPINDSVRVPLRGSVHPLAVSRFDRGAVEESLPTGRLLLLLRRSLAQEEELRDFIEAAHTPGSPQFRKWLTPEEFGRLYGPADSDMAAVRAWLESHGLAVENVHAGRLALEFSGTAAQIRSAFHTEIHRYAVNGETHLANATEAAVPAALVPVIAGVSALSDFHAKPQVRLLGNATFNAKTHEATPLWTYPSGSAVSYALAPGDFATQYDINSVYKGGINGTGQSIAIISESNVDLSLVQAYQALFGIPANLPQVVVDGTDPGQNDAATEAYLDIEIAGSVAPGAKIMLYTSGGTAMTDGLALAALRAVEDDQAGIISTSYAACELYLGQSGNAFWNALWQQAAAQGQTAFVSAGDAGSAGCDDFNVQTTAFAGLQVNGIASTPYDVAVGGTDFYYSQYAGTASAITAQLNGYWSAATTSQAVSLKQIVPEQSWNNFFGFNLLGGGKPSSLPSQTILAGGGGVSSVAYFPTGTVGQGYPKPAWQSGKGVPADKVRDLPDLSLFAANGNNSSFYPVCAQPGDCSSANLNSSGAVLITGVGGTSASSPAMAGIQALVNQSAGVWAGQANFIYYPLAARQPGVFRDITSGGNQVLCNAGTFNCVQGQTSSNSGGFLIESGYPSGAGYDLASGLGSVDVANLIKYWKSVTRTATTTTLSVNPASFIHGKITTVASSVSASGGGGTPTGSVSLTGNDGITHYTGLSAYSLNGGAVYGQLDNLPGGTYQLTAAYGGDGIFAASKSSPVTVTVTPENNTLSVSGWAWNPYDMYMYPLSSGITVPYGAEIFLDAQPMSTNATLANQPTPATGTVIFSDKLGTAVTTSTQPLNAGGVAEWSTGTFAPGNHVVSESYSGDPSYNASNVASAATFTVIPGSTSLTIAPLVRTVAAGASVAADLQLATGYMPLYGNPPGGTVTVKLGSQSQTVPWQAFGATGNASLAAVVTFANVASGILPLTASYGGDANWLGSSANGGTVVALSSKLTATVVLTSSSTAPAPGQSISLSTTVSGPSTKPAPTGSVVFMSHDQSLYEIVNLTAGKATLNIPEYSGANGANMITAVYQGDSNYNSGTSNTVTINAAKKDFSLTTLNPEVPIPLAASGTSTLVLTPINGFSGAVALTVTPPANITAVLATAAPAVNASTTDVVTISVAKSMASGIYPVVVTATGGGHVHTVQIMVAVLTCLPPDFHPVVGTYTNTFLFSISDAAPQAAIYYTTDGTVPTVNSTKYTGAFYQQTSATFKAIAVVPGFLPSPVATGAYVIAPPTPIPYFSRGGGTFQAILYVTLSDPLLNAAIYYTTDGTTPTTSSTRFTTQLTVATTQTIKAIATAPGYSPSPVATATYTISIPTATPVISPPPGIYTSTQSATITDATPGAVIYYTTDSSAPTTSSTRYTGPIPVTATETVRAIATAPGYVQSAEAKTIYTMNVPATTPIFTPAPDTYSAAQSVTLTDTTTGAVIYYTTDGSTPTTSSAKYTGAVPVSTTKTIKAIATAPARVTSALATGTYIILQPAATPLLTPVEGTYAPSQTVTITDATAGAVIYYTTNGTVPISGSTRYTAPIKLSATQTIKAIATATGYAPSPVATAAYTIGAPTAAPVISPKAGSYTVAQSVTITDATAGAVIYYTTNSSAPTTSSAKYTAPINVTVTQTVRAMAIAAGYVQSPEASAAYAMSVPAAAPTFLPAPGNYAAAQSVTLTDATAGAVIYYTIDGSTPTTSSTKYTAAIAVPATKTIKAIATATGYAPSPAAAATYTIGAPTAAPVISPKAGSYTVAQSVTITDATAGAVIYYTTNSSAPTTSSAKYTAPINVTVTQTVRAMAIAAGYVQSPEASAAYAMSVPAAAPTFLPAPGNYAAAQSVTLTDATAGAVIYYTIDGSTPTTSSTKYTAAIAVPATKTIKAIATATGYAASPAAAATYTIGAPTAAPVISPKAGSYTVAQSVTITDAAAGAVIYYTTNSSAPTTSSAKYTAPINVTVTQTVRAMAIAAGYVQSPEASAAYAMSVPAAAPTFLPAPGNYAAAQSVTLTDATAGAVIYYTIDGSTPTTSSTKYTAAIAVPATKTIKAIATATGYAASPAAAATYTIGAPTAAPVISPKAGSYTVAQSVTITDAAAGAVIYYTTNSSAPTTSSAKYTAPINVTVTQTVRAMAIAAGYVQSPEASAAYAMSVPAAAPTFLPAPGNYAAAQSVTLTDATAGAVIYYTIDGSTPTTSSTKYTAAIAVPATKTIKAIATATGYAASPAAAAAYTIGAPTAAPAISPKAGSYTVAQSVTITDAAAGAVIYYTTNSSAPTTSSAKYTAPINVTVTQTVRAMAIAAGYVQSPEASAAYAMSVPAAAPTFLPAPGNYAAAQSVTLADATAGAVIYYTIDGSTPTTSSTKYTAAIAVPATKTIKAIATATGYAASPAAAATYTISIPAATPLLTPAAGTYGLSQTVTITDATVGAIIYYTTNGTVPTSSSTRYTAPIKLSATQTIEAIAIAPGWAQSAVAGGVYTLTAGAGHLRLVEK